MAKASVQTLADALPHIVWLLDADGSCVYVNQQWLAYAGLSLTESLSASHSGRWINALHPDDQAPMMALWRQALSQGEPGRAECRLRRADGAYRWMLGHVQPHGDPLQWIVTFTDIDDLRRAADRRDESHSINRIAGRVAHLGGWTIDLPSRKLTWSDENCAIHDAPPGYQPTLDEGIGYFFPEHQAIVNGHVQACAEQGMPYEFILPKRTLLGRHIWVRSIGEAVRDATGTIVRIQGAFQDITEQKLAEARTLALETQLRNTLESITDGFYLLGKDWTFIYLNGPAERMLQRRREDLQGKNFWQSFPQVVGTFVDREFRATVELQRTAHFESFYDHLNAWFEVHAYPTEAGLAVYFQDITQRRAEHAQLHLLQTAISRLNDMVVITEAEPSGDGGPRIVFVNDAFERCTGYTSQEAVGSTSALLWGPETSALELERIGQAMRSWQAVRAEVVVYTKTGQPLWLETDIAPIADASGTYTHWVAVERDITERKQQEQEIRTLNSELEERVLLRTAQLASANKELESFAYAVSHDLRSPLNTVHGFSQLLAKIDAENISEKGRHYLDRIGVGVKQMGELIEGLLTLAHLSRDEMKSDEVDLSAMARCIAQALHEEAPERQAVVHVQDGMRAQGDDRLLLAVLQNLMDNAWKFTSKMAFTRIELGTLQVENGETVFFIKDNGAGYNAAFEHKLFGTFERLHSPGDFAGTGIGLATVKRIIERHDGRVWAQSKPGQGATFFFTLASATSHPTNSGTGAEVNSEKIVITQVVTQG